MATPEGARALEADLAIRGLDLWSMKMWQVRACTRALANDRSSLTAKAAGSDGYTMTEHLLFLVVDTLNLANWQRTGKRTHRPKPMSPARQASQTTYGSTDRDPQDVAAVLARHAGRATTT